MKLWSGLASRLIPRRLPNQLAWLFALMLSVTVALHTIYAARQQSELTLSIMTQQASALSANISATAAQSIVERDYGALETLLMRADEFTSVRRIVVTGPNGNLLSAVRRGQDHSLYPDFSQLKIDVPEQPKSRMHVMSEQDDSSSVVAWVPVTSGTLLGWVRLEVDTESSEAIRIRIIRNSLFIGLITITVGVIVLLLFLRRFVEALQRATLFAVGLAHSRGAQLAPESSSLESEQLVRSLNWASTLLNEQSKLVQEHTAQLDTLFKLSPDGFVAFSVEDTVKFANPAFHAMTGIKPEEIINRPIKALEAALRERATQPEMFSGFSSGMVSDAAAMTVESMGHQFHLAQPRPSTLQWVSVQSEAVSIARFIYFRDVTAEAEINRMKSEFLSSAAHELRTPMASIYGFAELLLETELDEETRRDLLETIHRQTKWLVDIINELLDLARIEARQGRDFKIDDIDLVPMISNSVADLGLDHTKWPVTINIQKTSFKVRADPAKVRQAFTNVVGNAKKYSPNGGEITIKIVERPSQVGIAVSDHGIGMTPDQVTHIGERFWRADASGKTPGTGLGMAIVKEIMELHGGALEVTSQVGVGTTMTLWFTVVGNPIELWLPEHQNKS